MNQIKKILAPTDFSELSQVGVRYALNLAKAVGAEVTVYHVLDSDELKKFREGIEERVITDYSLRPLSHLLERYQIALARFLNDHFSDLIPSVKIREKVEMGVADKNIVELAEKEAVDLIVISTHGRTGLSHVILGSVTEKVVRNAACPVLSIRSEPKEKPKEKVAAVV